MMNPSKLDKRISFYRVSSTVDEYGAPIEEFQKVYSCCACLYTQSIKENYTSAGTDLENSICFIVRETKKFIPLLSDKVEYKGKMLDIKKINETSSNSEFYTIVVKDDES